MIWDVTVIGGGAAGLMAATSAASRGKAVLLLEKNNKIGVKILMSGGTRCNITHDCGVAGIIQAFGRNGKFLHSALAALTPADVIQRLEGEGVPTKVESTGKIFPVSDRALDVRDALVRLAAKSGASLLAGQAVETIAFDDSGFQVTTEQEAYRSRSVIITTGGKSYPGCGTTGDGYGWAEQFGHSIVAPYPALTPILTACAWAHELKGITLDPVHAKILDLANGSKKVRPLAEQTGSFLFTHWGFSGPVILDVSREVARHPQRNTLELVCDFWPELNPAQLLELLQQRKSEDGRQAAANLCRSQFPKRFQEAILEQCAISPTQRIAELSKAALAAIVAQIKSARFPISGTLGFEKAEVTSGGVSLSEIDSRTMASKLVPGLYFAGEVLDLDGRIGGYNFQSAFSTGWLAGLKVSPRAG